jgi:hypothetical protein
MLGNILIVISLISYGLLASLLSKPMPGGDYGVGYSYAFMFYGAGFVISTGLLAWNMNVNHCFDWVLRYRNILVFVGWIAFVTMTFWSLEYHKVFILLHLLIFGLCIYLINAQQTAGFPPAWAKTAMRVGFVASLLIAVGIFGAFGKIWVANSIHKIQSRITSLSSGNAQYKATLEKIKNHNDTSIHYLLEYVDPNKDNILRKNAIAKIKTYPDWEEQMLAFLMQKNLATIWAYEADAQHVYSFLDENKVEHPEKFIKPIKYNLEAYAIRAERDLNDPYNRELWSLNLEAFCRVLESQFKDYAQEFKPGMLKLQEVLAAEYPERASKKHIKWYDKTVKAYRLAVKNWLDANR